MHDDSGEGEGAAAQERARSAPDAGALELPAGKKRAAEDAWDAQEAPGAGAAGAGALQREVDDAQAAAEGRGAGRVGAGAGAQAPGTTGAAPGVVAQSAFAGQRPEAGGAAS